MRFIFSRMMTIVFVAVFIGLLCFIATKYSVGKELCTNPDTEEALNQQNNESSSVSLRTFRELARQENREMNDLEKESDRLQALMEELVR